MRLAICLIVLFGAVIKTFAAPPAAPAVPEPLKSLDAKIGGHWAFKGTVLSFKAEQPITDEQWKAIESLTAGRVVNVYAGGKGIGDADFERFAKLPLEGLSVDGATITDSVFASIAKIKTLKSLGLSHALKLTGAGVEALAGMPALETISIGGTGFSDTGMPGLAAVKTLKKLNLNHDRMTDAGVAALVNHPAIESFMISPQMTPRITDASLATLATIKSLKSIEIDQTVLTYDAGLKHLKALPDLQKLTLNEVGLEEADLAKLKADLPKVDIKFTPAKPEAVAKWREQAAKKPVGK